MTDIDLDTKTIAEIVGKIKSASGVIIDTERLSTVLKSSLDELKKNDPNGYIKKINDISDKLEAFATDLAKFKK